MTSAGGRSGTLCQQVDFKVNLAGRDYRLGGATLSFIETHKPNGRKLMKGAQQILLSAMCQHRQFTYGLRAMFGNDAQEFSVFYREKLRSCFQ
jgi:hypothetical protein